MLALIALLVLIPLCYIPGLVVARVLSSGESSTPDLLEQSFERVVFGVLIHGWLALLLAEFGVFSIWLHLSLITLIIGVVFLISRQHFRDSAPKRPAHPASSPQSRLRLLEYVAYLAIGVSFWVIISPPHEVIVGARDAGVYANTGFAIARTGGIVQSDPLVAQIATDQQSDDPTLVEAAKQAETNFLGVANAERFIATRLRAAGFMINEGDLAHGRVVPQFFHLYPVWIGLVTSMLGPYGGLMVTGWMGLLGLWAVAMLGRTLAHPLVGVVAALLLALNGVQVWFSRYSTSETTTQFLMFAGLYFFAIMHRKPLKTVQGFPTAALIAGIALGQLLLVRIDPLFLVAPFVFGYLGYAALTRRWLPSHTWLGIGFAAMTLHAVFHVIFIARAYFFDTSFARLQDFALIALLAMPFITETLRVYYLTRPGGVVGIRLGPGVGLYNWRRIITEIGLLVAALGGIWGIWRWGQAALAWFEHQVQRWGRWLLWLSAVGLFLLAVYAYGIRPQILNAEVLRATPTCLSLAQLRTPDPPCLRLQGYIGAPIALPEGMRPVFAIPLANFVRFGWYLSPLGVIIGVAGFLLWWVRGFDRRSWLFLITGLLATIFWVRQSYGTSDQTYIYILRRYIPVAYPLICLSIAYALVWLWQAGVRAGPWPRLRWFGLRLTALANLIVLVAFLVVTNRTIYRHVEYAGAIEQIGQLAARFAPGDVVLLRGGAPTAGMSRDMPDLLTTPLIYGYGVHAFTMKSREPGRYAEQLTRYVQHWQEQGRTVYALLSASGSIPFPGQRFEPLGRVYFSLREFEALTDQKPTNLQDFTLDYQLYRLVPETQVTAIPATIQPTDFAMQVRGFWRPEDLDGNTIAWTDGDGQLRIPWNTTQPYQLTFQLAAGKRPPSLGPAEACIEAASETTLLVDDTTTLQYQQLGCVRLQLQSSTFTVQLDPRQVPPGPDGYIRLRIVSSSWIPAQTPSDPPSNDQRSVGVQFINLQMRETSP